MKSRTLLKILIITIIASYSIPLFADSANDAFFNSALKAYVNKLLLRHGKRNMDRERFLVQQIRMINEEMRSRINGVSRIRDNYFQRLDKLSDEVSALKARLTASQSRSLNAFVDDVQKKIKQTINSGTINYKKQKAIEEAVQLLHIAEEMIQSDPNARLEENSDFSHNLQQTKNKFRLSFGERLTESVNSKTPASEKPTVFDIYNEWKKTEILKYQVRWTDVQIIKRRLYKNGTATQREAMFKRELQHASEAFNYGMYDLAERSFAEILRSYKQIGPLDDVLFFKGQSNYLAGRYHEAEDDFNTFILDYPSSSYLPEVYRNLIRIAYHFDHFNDVLRIYRQMRSMVPASDPGLYQMTMIAAVSALKDGQYEKTIEFAFEIPSSSPLYREARFILAEAYAGMGNFTEAQKEFTALIKDKDTEPEFHFTVLLKLGYLSYELGDYNGALRYFDQIAGNFSAYDRVLIGYGWTLYKQELSKKDPAKRDFKTAEKYLRALIDNFYGSDYILEARTLLGYVLQLQEKVDGALENYEYAFQAKEVKQLSDTLNYEYNQLNATKKTAQRLQEKALQKNNPAAFHKAYNTVKRIRGPLTRLGYIDMSASGVALKSEISRLNRQLAELDRLKKKAQARENSRLVRRIETLQLKIYRAVNSVPKTNQSAFGFNYFDAHPLARKESVAQDNNKKILQLRADTQKQREEISGQIARLDMEIQAARSQRNYRKMIQLELSKERLSDLAKKLDFLDTRAYSMTLAKTNINLDHWSNYGAFGMTNVRFAVRKAKAEEIARYQAQIQDINDFLEIRKKNIEHKIHQIDDEITLMTRRVRQQERQRERDELKRQFEESYFDTHDTELDYDQGTTTQPPMLDDTEK